MVVTRDSLEELLAAADGRDAVWCMYPASSMKPDPDRFRSNRDFDFFCRHVLHHTNHRFLVPEQSLYRHHELRMSPVYLGETRFKAWMYIHDREGRLVTEILPRAEEQSFRPYAYQSPERRPGTYLYLGYLIVHFGHVLTELLSRLWPDMSMLPPDTRVLLHYRNEEERARVENSDSPSARVFRSLLAAAGLGDKAVEFVDRDSVYETVLTPTPQNIYRAGARAELAETAAKLLPGIVPGKGKAKPWTHSRIFYSRRLVAQDRRKYYNALEVEEVFMAHGFKVVHPQFLSFAEQVDIANQAKVIAGEEGSAFCNAFFAENPVILYLESGRFHTNLPIILYQTSLRLLYLLPVGRDRVLPTARLFSQLYADPYELDCQLTKFLGIRSRAPKLDRPPETCALIEQAFLASLVGDVGGCLDTLATLLESDPLGFDLGMFPPLTQNLEDAKAHPEDLAAFQNAVAAMIRALATLHRPGNA